MKEGDTGDALLTVKRQQHFLIIISIPFSDTMSTVQNLQVTIIMYLSSRFIKYAFETPTHRICNALKLIDI